jgi:branched-subunit amino acid aminotransferase/4-amino-4-deoxychorismate lyase
MSQTKGEFAPWRGVFETLRVVDGVPLFMAEHLEELGRAMEALELTCDFNFEQARAELLPLSGRWRWLVTPEGTRTFFSEEDPAPAEPVALSVSPVRVGSCNWDAHYKTVSYLSHVQAWKMALTPEVILLNEHGHVASASRANIFWRVGDRLYTPSRDSGCRRGVVRTFILERHKVKIGQFPSSDLLQADEIFLTNSMKGIVSVNEMKGRSLRDYSRADQLRQEYAKDISAQLRR